MSLDWHSAPAAAVLGLSGVDRPDWPYARLVLGRVSAHGERVSGVPEDGAAPAQSVDPLDTGRDTAAEPPVLHGPSAGLDVHPGRAAPRDGGLQSAVVAGDGLEHARPPLLSAHPRAVAHAAVPHECGVDVRGRRIRRDGWSVYVDGGE